MKKRYLRSERERHRREENRIYILKAAEVVFAKKGYSFTTMDDVAEEAQFSKATLYHYFKSKGEIFFEIILDSLEELNHKLRRILEKRISAREKLKDLVHITFNFFQEKENISRIFLMEKDFMQRFFNVMTEKQSPTPNDQDLKHMKGISIKRKVLMDVVSQILVEGIESGEFRRMDVMDTAYAFTSLVHGFYFSRFWRKKKYNIDECTDLIHTVFLEGIKKA